MPPADLAVGRTSPAAPLGLRFRPGGVTGWGGGARASVTVVTPDCPRALREAVASGAAEAPGLLSGGAIARGLGRSYGDAAQLTGGTVLDTTGLRDFELDPANGVLTAQAGVSLGQLLAATAPAGWILPTVPGTQHVSLGGAIASDIHGKNHGAVGTFGAHVLELGLLSSSGEVLELGPGRDRELFGATLGGMGLTGVILWARIQLRRLTGSSLAVDSDRVESLDAALAALEQPGGPHRVAWLDLLGRPLARGVVTRAEHLVEQSLLDAAERVTVRARMTLPPKWPGGVLRTPLVRAHNELRFRLAPRRAVGRVEAFGAHMFPLDVLGAWPRLYNPLGFLQYQLVLPRGQEATLETVIERLRRSGVPCYLAVLKDFGPESFAPLSFPLAGWTLTLDVPRGAPGLEALLRGFDELVAGAGGRVYLSKDSRMAPDMLAAMYPRLGEWRTLRDRLDPERVWRSDLSDRLGLVEGPR